MRRALLLAGAVALLSVAPVEGQEFTVRAAAGAAVPVGGAGERYDPGPVAMVSMEPRRGGRWGLRLDGEWALLRGAPPPPGADPYWWEGGNLRSFGVSVNGLLIIPAELASAYLLAGLGAYRLQRPGAYPSPYGTTVAVQAGLGVDLERWERINPFVEARAQVHLTDYGSAEFTPTIFWPVLVGVRIR